VENGHSPDENHVSRTSVSCFTAAPHSGHAVRSSIETVVWLFAQWNAGMRWPHQSCREIVQSWMFSIQLKYVASHVCGVMVIEPLRTASMAGFASGSIFTNHCSDTIGSMSVSHLPCTPTLWRWSSILPR
jgi:hypothetical protein